MQQLREQWPLLLELFVVFGVLPVVLIYTEDVVPVIPTLLITAGILLILLRMQGWSYRELCIVGEASQWRNVLLLFLVAAPLLTLFVWAIFPERFLAFPRSEPYWWLMILALYPILSALPQEFIYRSYFFNRYGSLLGENQWALVLLSGLLFMWSHILFMNIVAFSATLLGGLLFAWRYYHTRSLLLVTVEHALYGNLFFTLGLGRFIFSGAV